MARSCFWLLAWASALSACSLFTSVDDLKGPAEGGAGAGAAGAGAGQGGGQASGASGSASGRGGGVGAGAGGGAGATGSAGGAAGGDVGCPASSEGGFCEGFESAEVRYPWVAATSEGTSLTIVEPGRDSAHSLRVTASALDVDRYAEVKHQFGVVTSARCEVDLFFESYEGEEEVDLFAFAFTAGDGRQTRYSFGINPGNVAVAEHWGPGVDGNWFVDHTEFDPPPAQTWLRVSIEVTPDQGKVLYDGRPVATLDFPNKAGADAVKTEFAVGLGWVKVSGDIAFRFDNVTCAPL